MHISLAIWNWTVTSPALFSCICNDLNPRCWISTHIHEHISYPLPSLFSKPALFLLSYECFHLQSMNIYPKTPTLIMYANLPSCLNLLCNNSAFYSASYVSEKTSIWLYDVMVWLHHFILLMMYPHQHYQLLVFFNLFMITLAGIPSLEAKSCQ